MDKPVFVQQINDVTCVHACISMVTGIPIEEICETFTKDRGVGGQPEASFLRKRGYGVSPHPTMRGYPFKYAGVYLVSVPSLNFSRQMHRVVVYSMTEDDAWEVLDPQEGRDGKEYYASDSFMNSSPGKWLNYNEVVRVS